MGNDGGWGLRDCGQGRGKKAEGYPRPNRLDTGVRGRKPSEERRFLASTKAYQELWEQS